MIAAPRTEGCTKDSMEAPVFVISLPGSPRRARIARALSHLGIPFSFVEAIEGRAMTETTLHAVYDEARALKHIGRPLGRGEVGCALSHQQIYRTMVDEGLPFAIVLEDDAILGEAIVSFRQNMACLVEDVELVSLNALFGFVHRRPSYAFLDRGLHRANSTVSGAVAYFIRLSAARKFLRQGHRIFTLADWPLDHRAVRHYILAPMVVGHGDSNSSLTKDRAHLQHKVPKSAAIRMIRAIFYLSFLGYVFRFRRYEGLLNYYDREVASRLLKRLRFWFLDVERVPLVSS